MDEKKFLEDFATIFDDVEVTDLHLDSEFKTFEEWSSLVALGLLAVMEEEYNFQLTSKDIENAVTIRDIFNLIQGKNGVSTDS